MSETEKSKRRSGVVAIVGRPNVGKSTLLNLLVGEKITIVSRIPQTTRHQIRGVYTEERGQIVFIDTPGLHKGRDRLDHFMNQVSDGTLADADCIIYLVDTSRRVGEEERNIVEKLKSVKCPVVMGLNKMDLSTATIPPYVALWEEARGKPVSEQENFAMVALSGKTGINVEKLVDVVFGFLSEGDDLYPEDVLTDTPQKLAIADIVREKLFHYMRKEVPHDIGVWIERMRPEKKGRWLISAQILVERDSQKHIVIGKQGEVLKKVGIEARTELEDLLETKVFLELHVKVQPNWRDSAEILQELGYLYL